MARCAGFSKDVANVAMAVGSGSGECQSLGLCGGCTGGL